MRKGWERSEVRRAVRKEQEKIKHLYGDKEVVLAQDTLCVSPEIVALDYNPHTKTLFRIRDHEFGTVYLRIDYDLTAPHLGSDASLVSGRWQFTLLGPGSAQPETWQNAPGTPVSSAAELLLALLARTPQTPSEE